MFSAKALREGQELIAAIMKRYTDGASDEFFKILYEHILLHPFDGHCTYPLSSPDFPPLTLDVVNNLCKIGFTVDIGSEYATIYWVENPD